MQGQKNLLASPSSQQKGPRNWTRNCQQFILMAMEAFKTLADFDFVSYEGFTKAVPSFHIWTILVSANLNYTLGHFSYTLHIASADDETNQFSCFMDWSGGFPDMIAMVPTLGKFPVIQQS